MNAAELTLKNLVTNNKLPHGLLFFGSDFNAQRAAIESLAKTLSCIDTKNRPCGVCKTCLSQNILKHPDIRSVRSIKSEIVISQTHEMMRWLFIYPNELNRKIVWIEDGQNLNVSSSNALLKVLEEPPAHAIIIISVERPDQVITTIRSRLMLVRIPATNMHTKVDIVDLPPWLDELDTFLDKKSPPFNDIFEMTEKISKERENLHWFLKKVQEKIVNHAKQSFENPSNVYAGRKYENLYRMSLSIEHRAYQQYGNVSLYLDDFFSNWFYGNS